MIPLLIFSDLDGTLLDHDSYDWSPARPALARVKAAGGGVVLATSKTAAEVAPLRREMDLASWPAIVENGAGLLEPGDAPDAGRDDYARLRAGLDALPATLREPFTGFGDLDDSGVAAITGLSLPAAALARQRAFSEPGTWTGTDSAKSAFIAALKDEGIVARMGGRFLTLSFGRTKADAMANLIDRFQPAHTVALGDAPNDIEMLGRADLGVIIPNTHGTQLPHLAGETTGQVRRAPKPGPTGWNIALCQVMDERQI